LTPAYSREIGEAQGVLHCGSKSQTTPPAV